MRLISILFIAALAYVAGQPLGGGSSSSDVASPSSRVGDSMTSIPPTVVHPFEETLPRGPLFNEAVYQSVFANYTQAFRKRYTQDDVSRRYAAFKENMDFIAAHNQSPESKDYQLGFTKFSDLTLQEFVLKAGLGCFRMDPNAERNESGFSEVNVMASSVDWRQKNVVAPVKDQGNCGSCWAFGVAGSIESLTAIKGGQLIDLSEQQLLDCDKSNYACNGGFPDNAFKFVVRNGGLATNADYPYQARQGTCNTNVVNISPIRGYRDVRRGNETALMAAVNVQPVVIAIQASQRSFMNYRSGVFTASCGTRLDHAVLLVGYGDDPTSRRPYWIVKNSWGAQWGENGYIRMVRGRNICGIANQASVPTA